MGDGKVRGLGRVSYVDEDKVILTVDDEDHVVYLYASTMPNCDLVRVFNVKDEVHYEAVWQHYEGEDQRLFAVQVATTQTGVGKIEFLGGVRGECGVLVAEDERGSRVRFYLRQLVPTSKGINPQALANLLRVEDQLSFVARLAPPSNEPYQPRQVRNAELVAERLSLPCMETGDGRLGIVQQICSDGSIILYTMPMGRVLLRGMNNWSRVTVGLRLRFQDRPLPAPIHNCRWEAVNWQVDNTATLKVQTSTADRGGFNNPSAPVPLEGNAPIQSSAPAQAPVQAVPPPPPQTTPIHPAPYQPPTLPSHKPRPPRLQPQTGDYHRLPPPPVDDPAEAFVERPREPSPLQPQPPPSLVDLRDFPSLAQPSSQPSQLRRANLRTVERENPRLGNNQDLVRNWASNLGAMEAKAEGLSLVDIEADAETTFPASFNNLQRQPPSRAEVPGNAGRTQAWALEATTRASRASASSLPHPSDDVVEKFRKKLGALVDVLLEDEVFLNHVVNSNPSIAHLIDEYLNSTR